jgi:hypothetical protein
MAKKREEADTRNQSKPFFCVFAKLSSEGKPEVEARLARFFLVQTYQNGKNILNDHKLGIPNGYIQCQTAIYNAKRLYSIPNGD